MSEQKFKGSHRNVAGGRRGFILTMGDGTHVLYDFEEADVVEVWCVGARPDAWQARGLPAAQRASAATVAADLAGGGAPPAMRIGAGNALGLVTNTGAR